MSRCFTTDAPRYAVPPKGRRVRDAGAITPADINARNAAFYSKAGSDDETRVGSDSDEQRTRATPTRGPTMRPPSREPLPNGPRLTSTKLSDVMGSNTGRSRVLAPTYAGGGERVAPQPGSALADFKRMTSFDSVAAVQARAAVRQATRDATNKKIREVQARNVDMWARATGRKA